MVKQATGTKNYLGHQEAAVGRVGEEMSPPIQLLAAGQNSHNWIPAQGQ